MKEIKLKLFYVITILAFFVINAHGFALFAKLLLPLANVPYVIEPDLTSDLFVGMVVYTMIVGIADIFFLKQLNRQSMAWFFAMMVANTLWILLSMLITIIINNINGQPVGKIFDLLNPGMLIGLYIAKEGFWLFDVEQGSAVALAIKPAVSPCSFTNTERRVKITGIHPRLRAQQVLRFH